MSEKVLVPDTDVLAALDRVIAMLAESSAQHAEEIGGYIKRHYRPNPKLLPTGVAIMAYTGSIEFRHTMMDAGYPEVMATMVSNMVLEELRKLPGVDDVMTRFEALK